MPRNFFYVTLALLFFIVFMFKRLDYWYIGLIVAVLVAGYFWYHFFVGLNQTGRFISTVTEKAPTSTSAFDFPYQSALDGSGVMDVPDRYPAVVAVMVDNHPDARPERGLARARVVYEAPVEAPFTRFMALFAKNDQVSSVGPVRSARPYFIDWASEYKALYMHSGGSPEALSLLASTTLVVDANEFSSGVYYWRDNVRAKPHNLFTKNDLWSALVNDRNILLPTDWKPWRFTTSTSIIDPISESVSGVKVPFAPDYVVGWMWSATSTHFDRFINGVPYHDEDGLQVSAGTVVIQFVSIKTIDSYGRRAIATVGTGEAVVLEAGKLIHGTWIKQPGGRTKFMDKLGSEIPFMPGPVWVEVVPKELSVQIIN